jgi:hypothetical protein
MAPFECLGEGVVLESVNWMRDVEREVVLVEHFAAEVELEVVEDSLEVQ